VSIRTHEYQKHSRLKTTNFRVKKEMTTEYLHGIVESNETRNEKHKITTIGFYLLMSMPAF
jgi:hypothetical protein